MPIKYITRWNNKTINQIIDVRSPSEFHEDHIQRRDIMLQYGIPPPLEAPS